MLIKETGSLDSVSLTPRQAADLELLAVGGFSPLRGFQGSDDWRRVVDEMRLADGLPWSIPVTLATPADAAEGDRLALNGSGRAPAGRDRRRGGVRARPRARGAPRVPHDRPGAPRGRRDLRRGHPLRCRPGARDRPARAPAGVPAVPPAPGRLPRGLRRARLEDRRRLSDPQPDPPGARVHHQGGARVGGRPLHPPAGRRDEVRRHPGRRADALLRDPPRALLRGRPRDARRSIPPRCATQVPARRSSTP